MVLCSTTCTKLSYQALRFSRLFSAMLLVLLLLGVFFAIATTVAYWIKVRKFYVISLLIHSQLQFTFYSTHFFVHSWYPFDCNILLSPPPPFFTLSLFPPCSWNSIVLSGIHSSLPLPPRGVKYREKNKIFCCCCCIWMYTYIWLVRPLCLVITKWYIVGSYKIFTGIVGQQKSTPKKRE